MKDAEKNKDQLLAEVDRLRQEIARLRGAESGHKRLQEAVIRRAEELDGLNALAVSLGSSLELQHLVDSGIESTVAALGADAGIVLLYDSTSESFTPAAQVEISDNLLDAVLDSDSGEGILARVANSGEVLEIPDLENDSEKLFPAAASEGFRWCAAIPARGRAVLRAVIVLLAKEPNLIGVEREELPEQIGRLFGMALANAQEYRLAQQEIVERMVVDREQARLNEQLQERARRLQQIAETVPVGLLLVGGSGKVMHANSAAEELLESLESTEKLTEIGELAFDEILSRCCEAPWVRVDFSDQAYQVAAKPLPTSNEARDEAELWALVLRRVDDEPAPPEESLPAEAESQSPAAEAPSSEVEAPTPPPPLPEAKVAELGQLAGAMASHLNDKLGVVALHTDLALRRNGLPESVVRSLMVIDQQVDEASAIFDRVIDFSQQSIMERRPDDLKARVENLARHIGRSLPESIKVELEVGEGDFLANIDPMRFEQVLMNIALNAQDAMPEGGILRMVLNRDSYDSETDQAPLAELVPGDWIRVTISDTGHGIDPVVQPHLFEPFFTTKSQSKTPGLGLSQALGLVQQHDGHLHVSTAVNHGTAVSVFLPPMHEPGAGEVTFESEDAPLKQGDGEAVLIVEDDDGLREVLLDAVRALRYRTFEAATADGALSVAEERAGLLKVVVVDTELPETEPTSLLAQLHKLDPKVRLILMSSAPRSSQAKLVDQPGVSGWLRKPATMERLSVAIAEALEV
jgi:signal transduction histidine kinase/CheY-like chemotaxis protein/GAF domain-containing protein